MKFTWDENKAAKNLITHKISFTQATYVFHDPLRFTSNDDRFDYGECRQLTVGMAGEAIIAAVVHTARDGSIRIISARPATRKERKQYYGQNNRNDV